MIPNFQGVVDPGNLKTPFSHANKNSKIMMFHCLFLPALQREVMTLLSGAFSAPRSHYIRTVLMELEHVEQGGWGRGGGFLGEAAAVQSTRSATRAPEPSLGCGGCSQGYRLGT